MPPRPVIPVSLWALGAVIAVERLTLAAGLLPGTPVFVASLGILAAAVALLGWLTAHGSPRGRPLRSGMAAVVCLCAALALVLASRANASIDRLSVLLDQSPVSSWDLVLESDMGGGGRSWTGRAGAYREGRRLGALWLSAPEPLPLGSRIRCAGRFDPLGDDDWGRSLRLRGLSGQVRAVRVLSVEGPEPPRSWLLAAREAVLTAVSPAESDGGALLAGGVCGYRGGIRDRGLESAFSRCGLSHLVAVSGGHLALLSSLLALALGAFGAGPRSRGLLTLGVGALFVIFCGSPPSAVRAWGMSSVALAAQVAGRRGHALSSVAATALVMAVVDPTVAGQLGFLLSVLSVTGICLFVPYVRHLVDVLGGGGAPRGPLRLSPRVAAALRSWRGRAADVLVVSVVSQASTLAVTVPEFGGLSVIAPLANAVLSPLFAVTLVLGMAAACLCPLPALQAPVLSAALGVGDAFCGALRVLADLPVSYVSLRLDPVLAGLVALGAALLLVLVWPEPRRRPLLAGLGAALLAGCLALLGARFLQPARVCVLDIGQGDAVLVVDGPSAVLVDTGPGAAVRDALARQGIVHLDAIVLTHLHEDHVGGTDDLIGSVGCDQVFVASGAESHLSVDLASAVRRLTGREVATLAYGDVLRVGSFTLGVISPVTEVTGEENADSVELALGYARDGVTLTGLLTGDAERDETGACLARGDVGDIDFLKVGHHGSEVSIAPEQARALRPELAVASAGEGNRYGHPSATCREVLESAGAVFLCTKDYGDVTVFPSREGPAVSTSRGVPAAAA